MNKHKILKCSAFIALVITVGSSKALAAIDLGASDVSGGILAGSPIAICHQCQC
jgi:hypothetical protein